MTQKEVCFVLGTRPEIIKTAPVIREVEKRNINYFIIHTGQHYANYLDQIFIEELGLSNLHRLAIGKNMASRMKDIETIDVYQIGNMMMSIEKILTEKRPVITLVQGDTNTTLAGSLTSIKKRIPTGHIEAGLRCLDKTLPEEINRIIVDHTSDLLFAPSDLAKQNLLREGLPEKNIYVTGNTIVDSTYQNYEISLKKSKILNDLEIEPCSYVVLTLHRQENVDHRDKLITLIETLSRIEYPIIFPIHPRSLNRLKEFALLSQLRNLKNVRLIRPLGYLDFLYLLSEAKMVLTDSGGIQEEAIILKVPCLTLRNSTERQETVKAGGNVVVGMNTDRIIYYAHRILNDNAFEKRMRKTANPYGDGKASERIVSVLLERIEDLRS